MPGASTITGILRRHGLLSVPAGPSGNVLWSIGEAFKGQEVALRQTGEERYEVYFCWKRIGVADFAQRRTSGEKGYAPLANWRVGRLRSEV